MYGGGKGVGGGGGRILNVLSKSVARAGVNSLQETIPSPSSSSSVGGAVSSPTALSRLKNQFSSSSNILSLSSACASPFSACNAPVSVNNGDPNPTSWPYFPDSSSDDYQWVSVDGVEEEMAIGVPDDYFLGPVPSLDEVHGAVSALTQVFGSSSHSQFITDKFTYNEDKDIADQVSSSPGILHRVSPAGSDLDWIEPSPHLCNSRMLHAYGPDRVYDAFHLLQSEPAIQRMVISLSSDSSIWNAILNNDVVRELRDSYSAEETVTSPTSETSDEDSEYSNPTINVVKWIFQKTMVKFVEVMEYVTKLLNELLKAPNDEKKTNGTTDPFREKLRMSFLLSVVVLLVVVVSRNRRA